MKLGQREVRQYYEHNKEWKYAQTKKDSWSMMTLKEFREVILEMVAY